MGRSGKRENNKLRKIKIERHFIKYPEGSCLISVGNTKVIVNATVDKNVPMFLRGKGSGWITAEYRMLPRSTHVRTHRDRVSGRNMEIQRLIGRSLRSVVDLKELGERTIWIDCDVIQADGGTRTASVVGGFFALVDCCYKLYREAGVTKMPIKDLLGAISVGVVNGQSMLDLSYEEDVDADVDMNIVMKGNGEFVEMQGTAEHAPFSKEKLDELLDLAKSGIEDIFDLERNILKDVLPNL